MSTIKRKRFTAADAANNAAVPAKYRELASLPGVQALVRRTQDDRHRWTVELKPTQVKSLFSARDAANDESQELRVELDAAREALAALRNENRQLRQDMKELRDENQKLEFNNARLLSNIAEQDDGRMLPRSQKSYHQLIQEKGIDLRGRPLQGGIPGSRRRR